MGLQETIKSVASVAIKAVGNIAVTAYFHVTGAMTYSPSLGTQTEAGAISISATDIAAVASSNSLTSVTTDFTGQNIPTDTRYINISGFTESDNNDYAKVSSVAANAIILTGITLVDEVKGDTVVIAGPYYKVNAVQYGYNANEVDGQKILLTDQRLLISADDLVITPKPMDIVIIGGVTWNIIDKKTDPAEALWDLQIRRP